MTIIKPYITNLFKKKPPQISHNFFYLSLLFVFFLLIASPHAEALIGPKVKVGADLLLNTEALEKLKNKNVGIITNHTGVDRNMRSTIDNLTYHAPKVGYKVVAIFAPEHGLTGSAYASEEILHQTHSDGIVIYSLHGKTRRPTPEMLKNIDVLIYDIQDIGSRSYTYSTTLFYAMEEAAKHNIEVIVLDRPNPINGMTIDGPMLDDHMRSMVGYINVPYCHGMTIGELAQYFNGEYQIKCRLTIVPMKGWNRAMTFQDTGLPWVPTSPQIPEASTALLYPTTGIIGELSLVNIGVGYTLPFKLIGAPWIDASILAKTLNAQKFPGVHFEPFHYRPFYGKFAREECHGTLIVITDPQTFKPVTTQYLIIGILKSLYPEKFEEAMEVVKTKKEMFHKVNGTEKIFQIMTKSPYIVWTLRTFQEKEREAYRKRRQKYLIPSYS